VEKFFKEKLPGTVWKAADGNPELFAKDSAADMAVVTNGTQTVRILVTDLGNTTKVIMTATKPAK
jgi:hypothetical protein